MGAGSSVNKETRVTKDTAIDAVNHAFRGKSHVTTVTIADIGSAIPSTGVDYNPVLDHYKTTNHRMHEWQKSPRRIGPARRKAVLPPVGHGGHGGHHGHSHHHASHHSHSHQPKTQHAPVTGPAPPAFHAGPYHGGGVQESVSNDVLTWTSVLSQGHLTRDQRMQMIRTMFEALDVDDSGMVTKGEFVSYMGTHAVPKAEAVKLFHDMDESHTGRLTIAKFDHYCAVRTLAMVRATFKQLDPSHDRQIKKKEFCAYFMGNGMGKRQINALWDKMDSNRNGKVNFVEYRDWAADNLQQEDLNDIAIDLGIVHSCWTHQQPVLEASSWH